MIKDRPYGFWYGNYPTEINPLKAYMVYDENHKVIGIREDTPEKLRQIWLDHLAGKN